MPGAPQRLDVATPHLLTMAEIARLRSLLFAPASRPDVLAKLPRSNPDGVVVDLEDAVPAHGKADARPHANRVGAELARRTRRSRSTCA